MDVICECSQRKYLTAVDYNMIKGMDDVLPITEFVKNNKDQISPEDAAIPIKVRTSSIHDACCTLIPLDIPRGRVKK